MGQTFSNELQKELETLEKPKVTWNEISCLQKGLASLLNMDTKNHYNIAFVGASGVGKSSLINAVRELRNQVDDALFAEVGEVECTHAPAKYVYPGHEHIVLWDIPGGHTARHKTETYFYDQSLDAFDFLIIVVGGKLGEFDRKIAKHAERDGVPFALVKSKFDQDITNKIKRSRKTCDEVKAELSSDFKNSFSKDLKQFQLTSEIFIVSEVGFDVQDENFVAYRNDELKLMKMALTISERRRHNRSQSQSRRQLSVSGNEDAEQREVNNDSVSSEIPKSASIDTGLAEEETASGSTTSDEDRAVLYAVGVDTSSINSDTDLKGSTDPVPISKFLEGLRDYYSKLNVESKELLAIECQKIFNGSSDVHDNCAKNTNAIAQLHNGSSSLSNEQISVKSEISINESGTSDDDQDGQANQQRRLAAGAALGQQITAQQLATALAAATGVNRLGASATTPSTSATVNLSAPPSQATNNSQRMITPDMFRQAIQQAVQSHQPNYEAQMNDLRAMGFANDDESLRALRASNGNLQAALEFIFNERERLEQGFGLD